MRPFYNNKINNKAKSSYIIEAESVTYSLSRRNITKYTRLSKLAKKLAT